MTYLPDTGWTLASITNLRQINPEDRGTSLFSEPALYHQPKSGPDGRTSVDGLLRDYNNPPV